MAKVRSLATWLLAALVSSCAALNAELVVSNAKIAPDGYPIDAIVVNGHTPGPVLFAQKHWHGIKQPGSAEMDGTAMVTQCPITSGNSFLYDSRQYHSHFQLQYCEGLRGPLIIYDPQDPYLDMYDIDNASTIITLMDWYHKNVYDVSATDSGPDVPLSHLTVEYGRRYRIRLMNMACKSTLVFTIDSHVFTIIEADGELTTPLEVDSLQILAGQRYSFILHANQPINNYWIQAAPNTDYVSTSIGGFNSAILRYVGAPTVDPVTQNFTSNNPLLEQNLHALIDPEAPGAAELGGADVSINLVSVWDGNMRFLINGYSYTPPPTPILMQVINGNLDASSLKPSGSVYTLPANKTIELSIPGGQAEAPHPFHLHGHAFSVVRSAGSNEYNYANPVRRDTTSNGVSGDNVTIRFRTDNPGPWFFHCHVDFHLEQGMAVVFAEDTSDIASNQGVTSAWKQLCPTYNALSPTERSLPMEQHRQRHIKRQIGH
ncbi:laccase hybrid [Suillus spraguei]|nr:laccase hybrid [Suillus spraguei]